MGVAKVERRDDLAEEFARLFGHQTALAHQVIELKVAIVILIK